MKKIYGIGDEEEAYEELQKDVTEQVKFTLEELELLEQCLSKFLYSVGGMPDVAISCAEKLIKLKGENK